MGRWVEVQGVWWGWIDSHGGLLILSAFHSFMYFLVCSKNHFYWKMSFLLSCYLVAKPHHFFPMVISVGQDPFAIACVIVCVIFCCCEIFLLLSNRKAVNFDAGWRYHVPEGAGGEPGCQRFLVSATPASADGILCQTLVVHMPAGQVAVCVHTSTQNSVKSYLLSSNWDRKSVV